MLKKTTLVFLICCAITLPLSAQLNQKKADSLTDLLATKLSDTSLCRVYIQLAETYQEYDGQKSLFYAFKSDSLAQFVESKNLKANSFLRLGMGYFKTDDHTQALKYLLDALSLAEEIKDSVIIHRTSNNIGNIYITREQVETALKYYLRAADITIKMNDKLNTAKYFVNIGAAYKDQKKNDLASEFYFKALKEFSETDNQRGMMQVYVNIATLYGAEGSLSDARSYLFKARNISLRLKEYYNAGLIYRNIGVLYLMQQKHDSAIYFLDSSIVLYSIVKAVRGKVDGMGARAEAYAQKGDFKKAYILFAEYQTLNDSIEKADNSEKFTAIEQKYKQAEQQKEIELIKKNEEIKNLQSKIWISILVIIVILIGFVAILLQSRSKRRKTENLLLHQQNEMITHQKKEITDSINYAKRIQESILPPNSLVKKLLPNSFILYKPKDIVSGDFYWVEKKDTKVVFAAVDCTGHGVPGAMMSVLGFNLLSQTVTERGMTKPSDILQHLDFGVNQMLRQSSETNTVRDGMDLALCTIDFKTKELQFAGAYNGLWIIRKDATEVEEIKPDKSPIGVNVDGVVDTYTNHERKLETGDTVYIFSDGYADQFGGRNGKKFKYKPMKELLLKIKNLNMEEQNNALNKAITEWQGDLEQVDDILVIGVRI